MEVPLFNSERNLVTVMDVNSLDYLINLVCKGMEDDGWSGYDQKVLDILENIYKELS